MELVTSRAVNAAAPLNFASSQAAGPSAGALPFAQPDAVSLHAPRFGALKNTTFVIPPRSLVLTVPGMFGPKASVEELRDYLASAGHNAHATFVPGIGTAQNMRDSTNWLSSKIDNLRTNAAQQNMTDLMQALKGKKPEAQKKIIQKWFQLDDSALGKKIVDVAHTMLVGDSRFANELTQLNPNANFIHKYPKGEASRLSSLLKSAREQLTEQLAEDFYEAGSDIGVQNDALIKTVNRLLDTIAPRVVLVGHSLGGCISAKTLQDSHDDIGLVISLGSPVNGTEEVPPSLGFMEKPFPGLLKGPGTTIIRKTIETLFPAVGQMHKPSKTVAALQERAMPFDTTVISVANPEDGLVTPENARYNEDRPNTLNITVSPLLAEVENLIGDWQQFILKLYSKLPVVHFTRKLMEKTGSYLGLSHHCGLVQNYENYWPSNGDMMTRVFDGKNAPERLGRLLNGDNNDAVRARVLDLMADRVENDPEAQKTYKALKPVLQQMAANPLPFTDSCAVKAQDLLDQL